MTLRRICSCFLPPLLVAACGEPAAPALPAQPVAPLAAPPDAPGGAAGQAAPTPAAAPGDATLPVAEELLARSVDAAGGAAAIARIHTFHQEARVSISAQNLEGTAQTWWKDGSFYSQIELPGLGVQRLGASGEVMWSDEPIMRLRRLEGREAAQAAWGAQLVLAAAWKQHFASATTRGRRLVDGREAYDVVLRAADGDEVTLTLDAAAGTLLEQSYRQTSPLGEVPVTVKFSDVRKVGGLAVPFRQETQLSIATMVLETTKLEFDVPVDETKFAMPSSARDTVTAPATQLPSAAAAGAPAPP
jgi:hypothetical protein